MGDEKSFRTVVIASTLSGVTSRLILHPIDTIKARIQVQTNAVTSATGINSVYKNSFDAFRTILKFEGYRGLYKGLSVGIGFTGPANTLFLGGYDLFKKYFVQLSGHSPDSFSVQFLSGFAAESFSCLIWVPHDVLKERMQVQRSGTAREIVQAIRVDGLRNLYKGYWITLGTFGPNSALYFLFYEQLKRLRRDSNHSFTTNLVNATCANAMASLLTNPLDVIKTRFQVQRRTQGGEETYKNFADGFRKIIKHEGIKGLWKGLLPRIAYSAPNAGIIMTLYELLKNMV
jgi:hypothetical protein